MTLRLYCIAIGMFAAGTAAVAGGEPVDFAREIRPLFNEHCVACHGGVKQVRDLSFVYREEVLSPAKSGEIPVVPGKPEESELMRRVTHPDEDERMPPPEHGERLSEHEISLLRQWIEQGAQWKEHWAFEPPEPQPLPEVARPDWCRQPLDYFVLDRLEREGLEPSPPAERLEWLRRVTFDLTGLPPTPEEVENFQSDNSPQAYEKVVDRLLASPAFGERWAALWMDLARYADSQGYEKDSLRTMWPYRDWLIRAINADMPYDEFTIRQLAGDVLPDPTLDDLVATAFHRNTPTNSEGGTDDEEFRVAAVIDRVNTTWQAWQGVTFGCVQCHAHPYEPIRHEEYYEFMAFFNTSRDWDLRSDEPRLAVPKEEGQFGKARELDRRLAAVRAEQLAATEALATNGTPWRYLKPGKADSTKLTQLVVKENEEGIAEVWTEGTVSHDSKFTLEFPVPAGMKKLTALRIDVLPRNPEKAQFTPELGFAISHLRGQVVTEETSVKIGEEKKNGDGDKESEEGSEGKEEEGEQTVPGEIEWRYAFGDELEPFDDPQSTLNPDPSGWGALPRIMYPRHLVVVPKEPIDLPAGARLRLVMRQEKAPNDLAQLVMNRSRYAVTESEDWGRLIEAETFLARKETIRQLEEKRSAMDCARLPIMQRQDDHLERGTAVFQRGNWLNKGEPVSPAIPDLFGKLPEDAPKNRLTMARWLVSDENPLTARVAVNRIWKQLFGLGLVETLEDFGSSGQRPSHPALLDHLALRYQNQLGWSRKQLLKELVLSATYRQDSAVSPELKNRDPRNRLLARGPRNRLTAEMIRDNALAISGLLSEEMFGPSVMPPQPDGIWRAARSSLKWEESEGADKYRRALYTFWRRSSPYPSLVTFDAPSRLVCSPRRITTNTPLQALVTLNDPVYMEAAVALARRVEAACGNNPAAQISKAYQLATGREPAPADLRDMLQLYANGLADYHSQPELAEQLGCPPQTAAMALVGNAILNLDAVLTK